MIIQHNISALNAHRNLSINNSATSKNLEKLSSGYRINRAADDAAGLAISEKMRGQIRGLAMAEMNVEHGINLIQTAEGGLQEIHDILQRMRELAVQSSNGTYEDENDRYNLNKELEAIKSEIDRISASTHYNGINLLDGTLGATTMVSVLEAGMKGSTSYDAGSEYALAMFLNSFGFDIDEDIGGPVGGVDRSVTFTMNANMGDTGDLLITSGVETGGDATLALLIDGNTYVAQFNDTTGEYEFWDRGSNQVISVLRIEDVYTNVGLKLDSNGESGVISGIQLMSSTWVKYQNDLTSDYIDDTHALYNTLFATADNELIFQIGANGTKDQRVGLHVDNMSSANLGNRVSTAFNLTGTVAEVSVALQDNANAAITVLDAAINQVSATRADLGALQNRMEHTLNSLGVTKENLTAAESTIRDVDMAKEMMEYTKNSILVQASQAMLAQAQTLPQGVLNLLQ